MSRPASIAERRTRGPFGIEPLYFDRHTLATGTSLHDLWSGQAPDLGSLTEYLAFGEIWRDEATFLEGIGRVPPGASLTDGHITRSVRSSPPPLTTAAGHALVERCWSTLGDAVERAAGSARDVVVSLSGGLDSAALAVAAVERFGSRRVRAVTMGFERDFPDQEPHFARLTADYLGIDWAFVPADETELCCDWPTTPIWPTEPRAASRVAWEALMPGGEGVILWGLGADSLLRGDRQHYAERLRRGQWRGAVGDLLRTIVVHGRRPALGLRRSAASAPISGPSWLRAGAPGLETAARLRRELPPTWRRGVDELHAPVWSYYFETEAPENTQTPHRYVYPFFDKAFAAFMETVPTAPWCVDKEILRAALRGRIPDAVRTRVKAPVHGEPRVTLSERGARECRGAIEAGAADRFFQRTVALRLQPGVHPWSDMAPLMRCCAVARWLGDSTV